MLQIDWKIRLSPVKELRGSGKCPFFITPLKPYGIGRADLPASYKGQILDCCTKETITVLVYELYSGLMKNKKKKNLTDNYITTYWIWMGQQKQRNTSRICVL